MTENKISYLYIVTDNSFIYLYFVKGAIIPHLVTQELLSLNIIKDTNPDFGVREKRQSSAEVDLVYSRNGLVKPIEIKSGAVGKLKSLHQ